MSFSFKLRGGWKGLLVFFGLGAICLALLVLGLIYLSKKDIIVGVSMIAAAVAAVAAFLYVHVRHDDDDSEHFGADGLMYDELPPDQAGEAAELEFDDAELFDDDEENTRDRNDEDDVVEEEEAGSDLPARNFAESVRMIRELEKGALQDDNDDDY